MAVLLMFLLCLQKLMAINLLRLYLNVVWRVLRKDKKNIKLGIKGSSTVQLYFQDCKVPVENLLGEFGRGHIIGI